MQNAANCNLMKMQPSEVVSWINDINFKDDMTFATNFIIVEQVTGANLLEYTKQDMRAELEMNWDDIHRLSHILDMIKTKMSKSRNKKRRQSERRKRQRR